jgi:hypothetical protein
MALPAHRQVRGRITGDPSDCEAFFEALQDYAEENGWVLTWYEGPVGFGDKGPIHKVAFGFTTKP